MADTTTAVIPYESLDPLTIGASGDEDKVTRDTLELEIPSKNLLAAIYPDEPAPLAESTAAARAALEAPVSGPRFSDLIASASKIAVIIDNQFRPTPQSKLLPPVLDAIEAAGKPAVIVCANGKVVPMSDSDIDQTIANMRQGIGLVAMRERAQLVNGAIEFLHPASGGTLVRLRVPREAPETHA